METVLPGWIGRKGLGWVALSRCGLVGAGRQVVKGFAGIRVSGEDAAEGHRGRMRDRSPGTAGKRSDEDALGGGDRGLLRTFHGRKEGIGRGESGESDEERREDCGKATGKRVAGAGHGGGSSTGAERIRHAEIGERVAERSERRRKRDGKASREAAKNAKGDLGPPVLASLRLERSERELHGESSIPLAIRLMPSLMRSDPKFRSRPSLLLASLR